MKAKRKFFCEEMGCASSSPLVSGGGPGGLVDSAKSAATEVMSSGVNEMHGKYELHITYICNVFKHLGRTFSENR